MALLGRVMRMTGALVFIAKDVGVVAEQSTEADHGHGKTTRVECLTTAANQPFTLEIYHGWAPLGAQRFIDLVNADFFTEVAFFRCVPNFLVQFGISPDPALKKYRDSKKSIPDDPSLGIPFTRGMLSFAGSGPDSRTTQLFITFRDLKHLGTPKTPWEVPFGVVTHGMDTVIDKLYQGYGDQYDFNPGGVNQGKLMRVGNGYLKEEFPDLDYFQSCKVVGVNDDPDDPQAVTADAADAQGEDAENRLSKEQDAEKTLSTEQYVLKSSPMLELDKSLVLVAIAVLGLVLWVITWGRKSKLSRLTH